MAGAPGVSPAALAEQRMTRSKALLRANVEEPVKLEVFSMKTMSA